MADNIVLNAGSGGQTISTEDNGSGVQMPRTKLMLGATHTDGGNVSATNALPVLMSDNTNTGKIATPNAALAENAAKWFQTVSILCALDTAAAAGSQGVQLKVESTANPNLRVGL